MRIFYDLHQSINAAPWWFAAITVLASVLGYLVAKFYSEHLNRTAQYSKNLVLRARSARAPSPPPQAHIPLYVRESLTGGLGRSDKNEVPPNPTQQAHTPLYDEMPLQRFGAQDNSKAMFLINKRKEHSQ